jgi:hypothetical protein
MDDAVEDILIVAAAVLEQTQGKPGTGELPCPICERGTVSYSVASSRAVAVRCSTPGCVRFMS